LRPFLRKGPPAENVRAIARDGNDRLWFAGSGLWVLDDRDNLHDLSAIPIFKGAEIVDLVPEGAQANSIVVSLGDRGLVLVRIGR